ncbi:hypothetical protein LWI29_018479 [Acer saccharum]|uniref:Uncharacterized protein n=1 Tax=Acer saccharum TaxID=4024 RepID=A0AA39TN08_ACESA|nr:hypothetical protein LWI29_018479 [Acer saccharum]
MCSVFGKWKCGPTFRGVSGDLYPSIVLTSSLAFLILGGGGACVFSCFFFFTFDHGFYLEVNPELKITQVRLNLLGKSNQLLGLVWLACVLLFGSWFLGSISSDSL